MKIYTTKKNEKNKRSVITHNVLMIRGFIGERLDDNVQYRIKENKTKIYFDKKTAKLFLRREGNSMTILRCLYCGKDRTNRNSKEPVICKKTAT